MQEKVLILGILVTYSVLFYLAIYPPNKGNDLGTKINQGIERFKINKEIK